MWNVFMRCLFLMEQSLDLKSLRIFRRMKICNRDWFGVQGFGLLVMVLDIVLGVSDGLIGIRIVWKFCGVIFCLQNIIIYMIDFILVLVVFVVK